MMRKALQTSGQAQESRRQDRQLLTNGQFWLFCLASTLFFTSHYLLSPILPHFFMDLGFNGALTGTLMATFMIASLVVRPLSGLLADRYAARPLMMAGLGVFAACNVLYSLLQVDWLLMLVRIAQGIGFAVFVTVSYASLIASLPPSRKAEGLGYYSGAIKIAMAFAPAIGMWMSHHHEMTMAFWLAALLGVFTMLCLANNRLEPSSEYSDRDGVTGREARLPISWLEGLRDSLWNRSAVLPGLVMASNSLAFGALIGFVPMIAEEKGLVHPEWFYTIYALTLIFSRTLTGRLSDVYGRAGVLFPGLAMVAIGLYGMAWSPNDVSFLWMTALYGLAAGTVQPSLMAWAADRCEPGQYGASTATFTMLSDLGIAAGMLWMAMAGAAWGFSGSLISVALIAAAGWVLYVVRQVPLPLPAAWRPVVGLVVMSLLALLGYALAPV